MIDERLRVSGFTVRFGTGQRFEAKELIERQAKCAGETHMQEVAP